MLTSQKRYLTIKRALDVIFSALLLVVLSPLLAVIALSSALFLGSPVLFRQQRPGLLGKPFTLYKFRSMKVVELGNVGAEQGNARQTALDDAGKNAQSDADVVATDSQRLTRYGAFLRKTSLDELPELINIFKGDMSFVGPRPLLMEYLPLYSPEQSRRHDVRPGLTGLAQVNGRNALDWPTRFAYDVEYVDNVSFKLDCSILWQTVSVVFSRKGVSSQTSSTMEPFRGSSEATHGDAATTNTTTAPTTATAKKAPTTTKSATTTSAAKNDNAHD